MSRSKDKIFKRILENKGYEVLTCDYYKGRRNLRTGEYGCWKLEFKPYSHYLFQTEIFRTAADVEKFLENVPQLDNEVRYKKLKEIING